MIKSAIKTQLKKIKTAIAVKNLTNIDELTKKYYSMVDKSAKTNVFHKNNANRKKSRLMKLIKK